MKKIIGVFCLFVSTCVCAENIYDVQKFGATNTGKELVTTCLQNAIDACYKAGGGVVYFPAGEYLSATLQLRDNVTLYLATGARLIATEKKECYTVRAEISDTGSQGTPMLIYGSKLNNISIKGDGEIMAQPQYYRVPLSYSDFIADDITAAKRANVDMISWKWREPNVTLIYLTECEDVNICGVRLLNSGFWTLHVHWCDRVNISGIYIYSDLEKAVNADGIDIDGSHHVTISNCIIETADDAICLKTTKSKGGYRSCENVVVSNCVLSSSSSALKMGTESYGDIRYDTITNCVIRNTNRGIGIFVRDGGSVEHVVFSNLQMECTRRPVGWWGGADAFRLVVLKRNANSKIGMINHVLIKDVYADVEGTSIVAGYEGMKNIKNVRLENVHLNIYPESVPDKRAVEGVLVKNAEYIQLSNSSLIWHPSNENVYWTHAFSFKHVSDIYLDRINLNTFSNECSPLFFEGCDRVKVLGVYSSGKEIRTEWNKEYVDSLILKE